MSIDRNLANEAYNAGMRFSKLYNRLVRDIEDKLPKYTQLSFIESELVTIADRYVKDKYGEDILFSFRGVDEQELVSVYILIRKNGRIEIVPQDYSTKLRYQDYSTKLRYQDYSTKLRP